MVTSRMLNSHIKTIRGLVVKGFAQVDTRLETIENRVNKVDQKIDEVKVELRSEISNVKQELKSDINQVKIGLQSDIGQFKKEVKSDFSRLELGIGKVREELKDAKLELKADIDAAKLELKLDINDLAGMTARQFKFLQDGYSSNKKVSGLSLH